MNKRNLKHGFCNTKTYLVWVLMRSKCYNKLNNSYKNYGARGIKVCERWDNFINFFEDMGLRPEGKVLNLINLNKDFSPENCNWGNRKHSKHGMSKTRTFKTWAKIRTRCNNPFYDNYMDYGAKGIRVCERWDNFINFLEDMGERPKGGSLRRYDKKGNYTPENCRWVINNEFY